MSNATTKHRPLSETLQEFATKVGCSVSTASRIKDGSRMPGRLLFNKIVEQYDLNPIEALHKFCGPKDEFGSYMRKAVFKITNEDLKADKEKHGR